MVQGEEWDPCIPVSMGCSKGSSGIRVYLLAGDAPWGEGDPCIPVSRGCSKGGRRLNKCSGITGWRSKNRWKSKIMMQLNNSDCKYLRWGGESLYGWHLINITTHLYAFYKVKTFTPIGANMLWDLTWPRGSSFCPIRVLNLFCKIQ